MLSVFKQKANETMAHYYKKKIEEKNFAIIKQNHCGCIVQCCKCCDCEILVEKLECVDLNEIACRNPFCDWW